MVLVNDKADVVESEWISIFDWKKNGRLKNIQDFKKCRI